MIQRSEYRSMATSILSKKSTFYITLTIFFIVFLLKAWVAEDAYISFRTVEQFFYRNGLRWNPHERVQAYTHPLWLFCLIALRYVSSHVFLNAIFLSLVFCMGSLFVLSKLAPTRKSLICSFLLLLSSRAYTDYSTSGLENPLSYLLIALFFSAYLSYFRAKSEQLTQHVLATTLCFSLALTNRQDLFTLLLIPLIHLYSTFIKRQSISTTIRIMVLGMLPFASWSAFSLIYYGFLFPNTAYAKLNTGISSWPLFLQGLSYLKNSLTIDPITLPAIALAAITALRSTNTHLKVISFGILLNLFYIIKVGGDFMSGRFLTSAFFAAVILIQLSWKETKTYLNSSAKQVAVMIFITLGFFMNFIQLDPLIDHHGVADERSYYQDSSLLKLIHIKMNSATIKHHPIEGPNSFTTLFPPHPWSYEGFSFLQSSSKKSEIQFNIGFYGFFSGLDKIIIDPYALSDPLLARLKISPPWRIGHFRRDIPSGYIESIEQKTNLIEEPSIHSLYEDIKIVTQGELWSRERIKKIIQMNFL